MKKSKHAIIYIIAIVTIFVIMNGVYAAQPRIMINAQAWKKTTLTVQILREPGLIAWRESYTNDVKEGINEWKSLTSLSNFTFAVSMVNQTSNPDVLYNFTINSPPTINCGGGTAAGCTNSNWLVADNSLWNTSTILGMNTSGIPLNDTEMTFVAAHEFGHVLGLGHSDNSPTDIMYQHPRNTWVGTPGALDNYCLSIVYSWMETGVFEAPTPGYCSQAAATPLPPLLGIASAMWVLIAWKSRSLRICRSGKF